MPRDISSLEVLHPGYPASIPCVACAPLYEYDYSAIGFLLSLMIVLRSTACSASSEVEIWASHAQHPAEPQPKIADRSSYTAREAE